MSLSPLLIPAHPLLPPPPAEETWISYADAVRLCSFTARWFSKQIAEGGIRVRLTERKLGNGRNDREVALSTLPAKAQARYQAELAKRSHQPLLALMPSGPQLVERVRVHVSSEMLPVVDAKHRVLEPILAMQNANTRAAYAQLQLADGTPVTSQNRMIAYQIEQAAARGEKLSVPTIKRWLAAHKREGVAGLARQQRKDAGRSRFFSQPEHRDAAALVAYLHLGNGITPGLSVQACHDMLTVQRELVGLTRTDLPSYKTVRIFLSHITPALKVLALKGRKQFDEQMQPFLSRAYDEPANYCWLSDHMICDVEVMNDCMPGAPKGQPIRLRLTAIIDYRSRYVVGYSWAWEGSSASIARALRFAVAKHGPCDLWYCDNGKDYVKVAAGAVRGYMKPGSVEAAEWAETEMRQIERTGVLARLGIRVTHCLAHHPQSKHVERFFRTVHLTFCKLWSTYTGGKPSERPEQTAALMHVHRKALRDGDLSKSHHPLASELMARFDTWVETYHAKEGHRGAGMGLASPAQVFALFRNPNQRPAPSPEELVHLLWDVTTAKVSECQVRVNKTWYAPKDHVQANLMMDRNTREVLVAHDPVDLSRVAILDNSGHLITMLEAKHHVRMAPDDEATQAQIASMSQMRGALHRNMRERLTSITKAGKDLGVMTPLELLKAVPAQPAEHNPDRITPRKPGAGELPSVDGAKLHTDDIIKRFKLRQLSGGKS